MNDLNIVEILLVEDDPNDAELTLRGLRKNNLANNIQVLTDGAEALDFFFCRGNFSNRSFQFPPKVILLDLKLPKVSGLEVLKIIKSDERTSRIPVVIVSSSRQEPDIQEAYKLGANSNVVKPVDFAQFVGAMNSISLYWLLVNEQLK